MYQFWLMFILLIISWAGMAVVVSVGDAIAFEMLGDQPHLYGNQRLWGAVGWGSLAFITGFLVDKLSSDNTEKDYTIIFYMVLSLILVDILISSRLQVKRDLSSVKMRKNLYRFHYSTNKPNSPPISSKMFVKFLRQTFRFSLCGALQLDFVPLLYGICSSGIWRT